jgi:hypothetical protein
MAHVYEVKGKQYLAVDPETFYKYQTYIPVSRKAEDKSKCPIPLDAPWNNKDKLQETTQNCNHQQQTEQNVLSLSLSLSHSPSKEKDIMSSSDEDNDLSSKPSEESKSKEKELVQHIQEVYDHYCLKVKPVKLTDTRKTKIKARLKEYSVDQLKTAIDNLAADPWILGDNQRGQFYGTLEYIFRNTEKTEEWLNKGGVAGGKKHTGNNRTDEITKGFDRSKFVAGAGVPVQ